MLESHAHSLHGTPLLCIVIMPKHMFCLREAQMRNLFYYT